MNKLFLFKKYIKSSKGFTLVELLVVIAIISILAGTLFVVINPGARIQDANNAAAKQAVTGFATNVEQYAATTGGGVYPVSGSGGTGVVTLVGAIPTNPSGYTYVYTPYTSDGSSGCTGTPSTGSCASFTFYVGLQPSSSGDRFIYDASKGKTCTLTTGDTHCN